MRLSRPSQDPSLQARADASPTPRHARCVFPSRVDSPYGCSVQAEPSDREELAQIAWDMLDWTDAERLVAEHTGRLPVRVRPNEPPEGVGGMLVGSS